MLPIVVGTNPERTEWLKDCLASIRRTSSRRRVLIHSDGGYEIAALRTAVKHFSRFVYIHDSCEVLSSDFWDVIDGLDGPAWLFGDPGMYLGVYDRPDLEPVLADAPDPVDKRQSIEWEGRIRSVIHAPTLWPEVTDAAGRLEERHGRMNLVLENRLLRKWKGNWGQG